MFIEENSVVTMTYQLFQCGPDGQQEPGLIDEKNADDPIEVLIGRGVLLPKLEEKLIGQGAGFHANVIVAPEDAFGPYKDELVSWVERSQLPKDLDVQQGMKFQTQGPSGDVIAVMVRDIVDEKVLLDGNHPLAGLFVQFDVRILRVRKATEVEVSMGAPSTEYH